MIHRSMTILLTNLLLTAWTMTLCAQPDVKGDYVFQFKSIPVNSNYTETNAPISMEMDLRKYKIPVFKLDFDSSRLYKNTGNGKLIPVKFYLQRKTQYKCRLNWTGKTTDSNTYYFTISKKTLNYKPHGGTDIPLIMNGGLLRRTGKHKFGERSYGLFYLDYFDIDGDGRKELVSGSCNDFVRVFEDVSTKGYPEFSENHSYVLADSKGRPIALNPDCPTWKVTSPVFYDFNKDGKKDIFLSGGITWRMGLWYYENIGTADEPLYEKKTRLNLECDPKYTSALHLVPCDFNGDGRMDLMAGSYKVGGGDERYIYFFEGLSNNPTDFKFKKGIRLKDSKGIIKVPGYGQCAVEVADWNHDGLPDLFAVSLKNLMYWENQGTKTAPKLVRKNFPKIGLSGRGSMKVLPGKNIISGADVTFNKNQNNKSFRSIPYGKVSPMPQTLGGHGTVKVIDWNGNGKKHDFVFSDQWGYIMYAVENDGKWKKYKLNANGKPIKSFGCVDPGEVDKGYPRMAMADINGDGNPDIIVNHEQSWRFGYLAFHKNIGSNKFSPEERLGIEVPTPFKFKKGVKGQAVVIDDNTILDYLTYPSNNIFDPAGGEVSFSFNPSATGRKHCLFHNQDFELKGRHLKLKDEFRIDIDKDGSINWHAGRSSLKSSKLIWQKGIWYNLKFKWDSNGMAIFRNNQAIAQNQSNKYQSKAGPRLYVGSMQTIDYIERKREMKPRLHFHKKQYQSFSQTYGLIDDLKISNSHGKEIFSISFDGNADGTSPALKSKVFAGSINSANRSAPDFADLNGDGLLDLIIPLAPAPNNRDRLVAVLHWFPNIGTKTKPRFGKGQPIMGEDSLPICSGIRSATKFVDWNKNGLLDMFLVRASGVVEFYENVGTAGKPVFRSHGVVIDKGWIHESGLDIADWNGDGQSEAIVMDGDTGKVMFFSKSYIDQKIPRCELREVITPDGKITIPEQPETPKAIRVKTVFSSKKDKYQYELKDIIDGKTEGSYGWTYDRLPAEIVFDFGRAVDVAGIDCFMGKPNLVIYPSGACSPKSYLFEYWDGNAWQKLFPKVDNSPSDKAGLGLTAKYTFPSQKTDKVRMTIYSSNDTGKRTASPNKPMFPPDKRTIFIREIKFYGTD